MLNFLPRDKSNAFENMFSEMAAHLIEGALLLQSIFADYRDVSAKVQQLKDIEHKCDDLTHRLLVKLHQTFITPFDREDIHALISSLDDVVDYVYAAGERLMMFDIQQPPPAAAEITGVILQQARQLAQAVGAIKQHQKVLDCCVEINRLENEADRAVRAGLTQLFKTERDPINLIKQKELLEVLEIATDKAEDAANVLETIVLKMS